MRKLTPAEKEAAWFRSFFGNIKISLTMLGVVFIVGVLPMIPAFAEATVKAEACDGR